MLLFAHDLFTAFTNSSFKDCKKKSMKDSMVYKKIIKNIISSCLNNLKQKNLSNIIILYVVIVISKKISYKTINLSLPILIVLSKM